MNELLVIGHPDLLAERQRWLQGLLQERRLSDNTVDAYERDTRQFLTFLTGHLAGPPRLSDISTLRPADLRGFLAQRRKGGAGARTLGRGLAGLRSFLRYLERNGLANAAGAAAVRSPKQPKSLPKPLTDREALNVVTTDAQLAEEPWVAARNAAVLTLLYGCGLRISEALDLTPGDFAGTPSSLRITGKGGKTRIVPLMAVARDAVATYLKLCPYHAGAGEPMFRGTRGGETSAGHHPARDAEAARRPRPARYGHAACAAPLLRHASAGRRRRSQNHPGTARPRQPVDDPGLYRRRLDAASGDLRPGASARLNLGGGGRLTMPIKEAVTNEA